MQKRFAQDGLQYLIASIWIINGLYCKILNLVPRHQQIVERILITEHARAITIIIGLLETGMALWIVSSFKRKLNALTQIVVVITMNMLEFFLAPDLLLWGKTNAVFALMFVAIIFFSAFHSSKVVTRPAIC